MEPWRVCAANPVTLAAFVDSVSDRYAEFITFGGLLYYFLSQENYPGVMVTFAATAGSVLVSYVKARAEGLGFTAKVGILTRVERYIVLIPLLIFNQPFIAVVIDRLAWQFHRASTHCLCPRAGT